MGAPNTCPMCEAAVAPGVMACGRCGVEFSQLFRAAGRSPGRWYHRVWVVLFLIFFVLGPFAVPLIWKNPRLSHPAKWGLTAVVAAYVLAMGIFMSRMVAAVSSSVDAFNATLTF